MMVVAKEYSGGAMGIGDRVCPLRCEYRVALCMQIDWKAIVLLKESDATGASSNCDACWKDRKLARRTLPFEWRGHTTFYLSGDCLHSLDNSNTELDNMSSCPRRHDDQASNRTLDGQTLQNSTSIDSTNAATAAAIDAVHSGISRDSAQGTAQGICQFVEPRDGAQYAVKVIDQCDGSKGEKAMQIWKNGTRGRWAGTFDDCD